MTISTIGDMLREVAHRARDMELSIDCNVDGLFSSTIAIIGDHPSERERVSKLPLTGNSGKLFWELVRPLSIRRNNTYISYAIKRQLVADEKGKSKISKTEQGLYNTILAWELQQLPNLQYIICLGNYALEAITGLTGITNYRGSVLETQITSLSTNETRRVKVIPFLNPSQVLREPKWEVMYKHDVDRFKKVLNGTFKELSIDTHINPSPREALQWIDKMQDEQVPCGIDIETAGNETACIGLANSRTTAMCINFRTASANHYSITDELDIRLRLQRFFSDPNTRPVMQNGMFDSSWLAYKDRLIIGPSHFDTMLAHHTLYPSLPHNLGFLTTQYTNHPFYKDDGKTWRENWDIDEYWKYNGKDAAILISIYQEELQELKDQKLDEFFFDHVMRLQPHLIRMTYMGVKADVSLKASIAEMSKVEVARLKAEFYEQVALTTGDQDFKPNPASPKQMADLFFNRLRLVGRGVATDVKNRQRMRNHPRTTNEARKLLDAVDALAKEQKFLSTYAEMQHDEDNKIRCEYKQTGVSSAPGRLSSAATLWESGTNLQNQPERAHQMFIAEPGYGFSYFDLAQAEARVVGWKAPIPKWMEQFEQARIDGKYDAHRALASEMFNIPYDETPKSDKNEDGSFSKRYIAKRCRHGLNYRMMPDRLAETLNIGISLSDAEELWRIYHKTNPELEKWWEHTYDEVKKNRTLFNSYGRRWILLERYDEEALKAIVAFYPQSTIGDKVSRCIYLCESDPDWPSERARIALNIHDALIAIHDLEVGDTVRRIMKKHAEEPIIIKGYDGVTRELIIPCDLKASVPDEHGVHRWSTLEKVYV